MPKFNDMKETHSKGFISIESIPKGTMLNNDLGIMMENGKVWICIDGVAFLRFKPKEIYKERVVTDNENICEFLEEKIHSCTIKMNNMETRNNIVYERLDAALHAYEKCLNEYKRLFEIP